jgi:hypothetical protein
MYSVIKPNVVEIWIHECTEQSTYHNQLKLGMLIVDMSAVKLPDEAKQ